MDMSTIHYIGHGRLESSPENFSILHVISHELSHVQEFKNEAFRSGKDVAEIRVKIDMEMKENGKLIAVSGETEAVFGESGSDIWENSLYKPYEKQKPGFANKSKMEENSENDQENTDQNFLDSNNPWLSQKQSPEDMQRISRKEYLEVRIKQLETEIQSLREKSESAQDWNPLVQVLDPRSKELEREKRKAEEELRLLQREEETRKNFQFLASVQKEMRNNSLYLGILDKPTPSDRENLDIRV